MYEAFISFTFRWTHVVVDNVNTKKGHIKVMFIATDDGRLRKVATLGSKACLIEEIKIVPNGEPRPVKSMKISPDKVQTTVGILAIWNIQANIVYSACNCIAWSNILLVAITFSSLE